MNQVQTAELLAIMSAAWPKFEMDDMKVAVWQEMFQDVPFEVAKVALQRLMVQSPYPPAIADLRKEVVKVTVPQDQQISGPEAWYLVTQAIRKWGWMRPVEALESLPPVVRTAAKYIGWRELCLSEAPDVIRAQFLRIYDTVHQRETENNLLPPAVQETIKALGEKFGLPKAIAEIKAPAAKREYDSDYEPDIP